MGIRGCLGRLAFVLPLVAACVAPAAAAPELVYSLRLDDLSTGRLRISLAVSGWAEDRFVLHGVPAYMDNPRARARGSAVRELVVRGGDGGELAVRRHEDALEVSTFIISPVPGEFTVSYELHADFIHSRQTEDYPIQLPFMDAERAWLYGNYVFCYPALGPRMLASLRSPAEITLHFELPPGLPLVGLPGPDLEIENLYVLMSLQFGFGSFLVEQADVEGVECALIYKDSLEFDGEERRALRRRSEGIVSRLSDFFGGTPFPACNFFFFRADGIGGLEGAYTCQAYIPRGESLADWDNRYTRTFTRVVLHEFFHTWNPIGVFALEDPWFKEGVTCYYDHVLSVRLGFMSPEDYDEDLDAYGELVAGNPLLGQVTLTDQRLWVREYSGEDWRSLSYERGQAVALLLDVLLRRNTDNRHSLDDVMRALFHRFRHGAYSHEQLLATIEESTGVDARPFFREYVEGLRPPSLEELRAALASARELGVFEPPPG